MANNIFNSFTRGLYNSLPQVDDSDEDEETYRWRFSKKRKIDEVYHMVDDHAIIYETDDDDYDDLDLDFLNELVGDYMADDFRSWRRDYIKKYKCKK